MLLPLVATLLILVTGSVGAVSPTVSNVRGAQPFAGQAVEIYYDLADPDSPAVSVTLQVSSDGGATWTVPATSLSGAGFGGAVVPGLDRHIRWEAPTDWPGQKSNTVRFRVTATDGVPAPGTMAWIPVGNFQMGNALSASGDGNSDELPVHTVNVSGFYMDRYEVSKALWDEVRAWGLSNGYTDLPIGSYSGTTNYSKGANHPVHLVSWYAIVKWCNARSKRDGLMEVYYTNDAQTVIYKTGSVNVTNAQVKWNANGYRLPTEAEWEKAARAGAGGHRFPWLNVETITHAQANYYSSTSYSYDVSPTRGDHPTYAVNGFPYTSPVGSFAPNGYGLYDMAGNVWEWCWDWYESSYYSSSPGTDPQGPPSASIRVLRGGNWTNYAYICRVADRHYVSPGLTDRGLGFRSVRR